MEEQKKPLLNRRIFFRNTALGAAAGATLTSVLPSATAVATTPDRGADCAILPHQQAEREEFEDYTRSFFEAYDSLDLDKFISYFSEDAYQQDVALGDLSAFGGPSDGSCSIHPKAPLRQVFAFLFERFKAVGGVSKFNHATGSARYGGAIDVKCLPNTFFTGGFDLISYLDIRNGKIFRRNDHWDTAQVTPQDIALIHPGGEPRLSCEALPLPGDIANASTDFYRFVRALSTALASGSADHALPFFSDDVLLIHPLLSRSDGAFGPFNRGIQIRGRKAVARFFKAALKALPDGEGSSLIHVAGGSTGGGYEWRSGGITAQQGIARNGIHGVTAIDLYGGRIQRISVKFDSLQMTAQQRAAIRRALADECLVA